MYLKNICCFRHKGHCKNLKAFTIFIPATCIFYLIKTLQLLLAKKKKKHQKHNDFFCKETFILLLSFFGKNDQLLSAWKFLQPSYLSIAHRSH